MESRNRDRSGNPGVEARAKRAPKRGIATDSPTRVGREALLGLQALTALGKGNEGIAQKSKIK